MIIDFIEESLYNGEKMDKKVLMLFPSLFYILGLFQSAITANFSGLITWTIMLIGLSIYGLFYYWFIHELRSEEI
jgi:hypothetical protein